MLSGEGQEEVEERSKEGVEVDEGGVTRVEEEEGEESGGEEFENDRTSLPFFIKDFVKSSNS